MAQLNDQTILDTYNTFLGGREADANALGKQSGNPWLLNIIKSYQSIYGRLPTAQEVAQVTPAFATEAGSGESYISQLYNQQNPYGDAKKKASEQYGTVDDLFQKALGRSATDEEKDHFGTLLGTGQYSAYDIQNMLQNLPENVRKQDEEFRKGLEGQLKDSDSRYFNEQIMPGIARNFAQSGRSFDSSAYAAALAREANTQNTTRDSFLANLSAEQYQGNKQNAYNDYWNNINYARGRSDTMADRNYQRMNELNDFTMQKQAYDQYLQRYGKRNTAQGIGSLAGGLVGSGLGMYLGGPGGRAAGGQLGYAMGSGFGGGAGSFF